MHLVIPATNTPLSVPDADRSLANRFFVSVCPFLPSAFCLFVLLASLPDLPVILYLHVSLVCRPCPPARPPSCQHHVTPWGEFTNFECLNLQNISIQWYHYLYSSKWSEYFLHSATVLFDARLILISDQNSFQSRFNVWFSFFPSTCTSPPVERLVRECAKGKH